MKVWYFIYLVIYLIQVDLWLDILYNLGNLLICMS